jgi:hypothetical protein
MKKTHTKPNSVFDYVLVIASFLICCTMFVVALVNLLHKAGS